MICLDKLYNIKENIYVRKSTNNYQSLLEAKEQIETGRIIEKTDAELEEMQTNEV